MDKTNIYNVEGDRSTIPDNGSVLKIFFLFTIPEIIVLSSTKQNIQVFKHLIVVSVQ
jgi:hypothetical protein